MKHLLLTLLSLSLLVSMPLSAQEERQFSPDLLDDILSQIAENREQEEIDETQLYDDLVYFSQNPINLNSTNRSELEKLQFLSDIQVENLLAYLHQYGPMQSLYELQLVDGFYAQDIRNLLPFVAIGKVEQKTPPFRLKNIFRYGRHEILARSDRGVETKEGYRFLPEEELQEHPNSRYLGDPFYYSLRYRFQSSRRVQFGFTGEKDAGEEAWSKENKVFDFYSGYIQLNDIWKFTTIVAGDFSASFGQGVALSTNFGFGKSSMVLNVTNRNDGLRKYSSTGEFNYFRGVGATMKLGKIDLTAFYSNKKTDGDTTDGFISSFNETGYHRTPSELAKKNNVGMQTIGAHAGWASGIFHLGATFINTQLDTDMQPMPRLDNFHAFSGKEQTVGSIDYQLRWRKLFFFGETAINDQKGIGTLNGLTMAPHSAVNLAIVHRYYDPKYNSIFANAFGENSRVTNEEGLYIAAEVVPFKFWKFTAYADAYRFPWARYLVEKPSYGYDLLLQSDYTPGSNLSMYWRVRFEKKDDRIPNSTTTTPNIAPYDHGSMRYRLQYSLTDNLKLRNILEWSYARRGTADGSWGRVLNQELSYKFSNFPLSIDLAYEFFDIPEYDNRIYIYERDVLYAFAIPALNGKGNRYYLNLKYELIKNLSIYFKLAQTAYIDRDLVGSNLDEISDNRKTDARLLLRWKF
ncbi:MAG: helix-hairpin-helix domain-containing protein [Prevotellaceae bacterium]|jgi:hypothetical protein|nr:helix-hairpin-helix domain-containing protein [Prevotellaceae bacterium]